MRTLAIGDIHGTHKAMLQCFDRSQFDYEEDQLIVLGDVCDGYPQVKQCIDELLKIKHCRLVIGNHDIWALDWALKGEMPEIWTRQGGARTIASYDGEPMPKAHIEFLRGGELWIERNKQFFVHGGFKPDVPLNKHTAKMFIWDRTLIDTAWEKHTTNSACRLGKYKDIFIGHTTTEHFETLEPLNVCNIWDLDTGAGWSGKLTLMDVDTKEYWQSDLTQDLYGGLPNQLAAQWSA